MADNAMPMQCPGCGVPMSPIDRQCGHCSCCAWDAAPSVDYAAECRRRDKIIKFLIDELENRDGYSPAESSCPECTLGTVPDNLNRGPCLYHQAKTLLGD